MPISTDDTVEMLNAKLNRKGGPALTMTWEDFYIESEGFCEAAIAVRAPSSVSGLVKT